MKNQRKNPAYNHENYNTCNIMKTSSKIRSSYDSAIKSSIVARESSLSAVF